MIFCSVSLLLLGLTSDQLLWTMLTHWGGLMSLADSAGFGSKNFVSYHVNIQDK